jgi:A/G-specific adenine glycosylase
MPSLRKKIPVRPSSPGGIGPDFARRLLRWYRRHKRDLPWRRTTDPYAVWVSEVMLQQTTVNAVIPYYEKWLALFPDARALARAPLQKVLKAWQGLGYYRRARNMSAAAKIIVARHGGRLPGDAEALRDLPGFGAYTTAAVLSVAFGRRTPLVDANVRRVLMRVFGIHGEAQTRQDRAWLERLKPLVPARRPGDFNQALMELGALVCRPKNPVCLRCPIEADCAAFAAGEQEIIPSPRERLTRRITAVVGVIMENGRVLIQRRPETGLLGGLWEFPGGKVKRGETLRAALARELREELGAAPTWSLPLMTVDHSYTQFRVTLHAFRCALAAEPKRDPKNRRWVRLSALRAYPFPSGSAKIVERLLTDAGSPAPPASGGR